MRCLCPERALRIAQARLCALLYIGCRSKDRLLTEIVTVSGDQTVVSLQPRSTVTRPAAVSRAAVACTGSGLKLSVEESTMEVPCKLWFTVNNVTACRWRNASTQIEQQQQHTIHNRLKTTSFLPLLPSPPPPPPSPSVYIRHRLNDDYGKKTWLRRQSEIVDRKQELTTMQHQLLHASHAPLQHQHAWISQHHQPSSSSAQSVERSFQTRPNPSPTDDKSVPSIRNLPSTIE